MFKYLILRFSMAACNWHKASQRTERPIKAVKEGDRGGRALEKKGIIKVWRELNNRWEEARGRRKTCRSSKALPWEISSRSRTLDDIQAIHRERSRLLLESQSMETSAAEFPRGKRIFALRVYLSPPRGSAFQTIFRWPSTVLIGDLNKSSQLSMELWRNC